MIVGMIDGIFISSSFECNSMSCMDPILIFELFGRHFPIAFQVFGIVLFTPFFHLVILATILEFVFLGCYKTSLRIIPYCVMCVFKSKEIGWILRVVGAQSN